jgi:cytochrome c oxidase cbb3-type subunit 4
MTTVEIDQFRIYAYLIGTGAVTIIFYAYIIYLYRSEKKGERNYEKYGRLAIEDELDSNILEKNPKLDDKEKKE